MKKVHKIVGFTLLELLIVLMIIGVLSLIVIPPIIALKNSQEEKIEQIENQVEERKKKVDETVNEITDTGEKL